MQEAQSPIISTNYWFLTKEGKLANGETRYSIRRKLIREDGSFFYERKPFSDFKSLSALDELNDYVTRLNGRAYQDELEKKKILTQHAWINLDTQEKFREKLISRIPNTKDANYLYTICVSKFLKFFLDKLNVQDPNKWSEHEHLWGQALMNKPLRPHHRIWDEDFHPSVKTIRSVTQVANQFLVYLCQKYPKEYKNLRLEPLTLVQLNHYQAQKTHDDDLGERTKYINANDWETIKRNLPLELKLYVLLAYYYGLRRSEALAVRPKDIHNDYLSVERQLVATGEDQPKTKPLKSRKIRKTPHWFLSASECYEIVSLIDSIPLMHPDTFSRAWGEYMRTLGFDYQLHDLRRTFITNCFRLPRGTGVNGDDVLPTDIQLAVGHENITTTMAYKQDDRTMSDDVFIPKKAT